MNSTCLHVINKWHIWEWRVSAQKLSLMVVGRTWSKIFQASVILWGINDIVVSEKISVEDFNRPRIKLDKQWDYQCNTHTHVLNSLAVWKMSFLKSEMKYQIISEGVLNARKGEDGLWRWIGAKKQLEKERAIGMLVLSH